MSSWQRTRSQVPYESEFDGAIEPMLDEVQSAAGLEGIAVLDLANAGATPRVLHRAGIAGPSTLADAEALLLSHTDGPAHAVASDYRPILTCPWRIPPTRSGGVILWRRPSSLGWTDRDYPLAAGLGVLLRTLVSSGAGQVGIDRLTGLPNRRWFLDEVDRHLDRMALDGQIGTLSVIEISNLRQVNAEAGREVGNAVLIRLSAQLRAGVRPGDAVARIAGDQFGVWQPAMDHLTAAERANALCSASPSAEMPSSAAPRLSIGIVPRGRNSQEDVRTLLRRGLAEVAQLRGKAAGGWRVAQERPLHPGAPRDMKT